ncbi:hypothetical protein [Pseudozobellia thermophila]|uniref:hypothetical protein n=1 Tax=Pseudozobellia thermophila TaxID=192903 RepID=UPI001BAF8CCB|nr:hypothetical protein [Pseudozobellia thermophila]
MSGNTLTDIVETKDHYVLLQRLGRNRSDIHQFMAKLSSYMGEPRTHGQFKRFNRLRQMAKDLVVSNEEIGSTVRHGHNEFYISGLYQKHLARFKSFAHEVSDYLGELKEG